MESPISSQTDFTTVEVDDSTYAIALPHAGSDYIQGLILSTQRPYEQEMLMAMKETLGPDDLVLDVGANVGNHTLFLAGVVGARVISYEPDVRLSGALERSIEHNGFSRLVSIRPVAVASKQGQSTLVDDVKGNLGAQHLTENPAATGTDVTVVALDDELPRQRVAAVKIDVEGFEAHVIDGALTLIERDRPDLWIECLDDDHFWQVFSRLSDLDYRPDGVFNASPTIRFVYDPVPTRRSLIRVVERLVDRMYGEHRSFLHTRSALQGANAKYHDALKSNGALRDELALWESQYDRQISCEATTEFHVGTDTLTETLNRLFEANDEVTGEVVREAMESVVERMATDRAEVVSSAPSDRDASGASPSEHRSLHQSAKVKALAESAAALHTDLVRRRSTNSDLLLEKQACAKQLTAVVDEVETLRSRHRRYRADFNVLREYVSDTELRLSELTRLVEDYSSEIKDLGTVVQDARAGKDESDRQLTTLQRQQVKDREHIGALVRARDRFRHESEQQTEQLENVEKQLVELESEHCELSLQKKGLVDELTTVHADKDSAEEELGAVKRQLHELRTSRTYRAGQAWRRIRTWKGFWALAPTLISIAFEGRRTT